MCLDGDEVLTAEEQKRLKRMMDETCFKSSQQGQCVCRIRVDGITFARGLIEARQTLQRITEEAS